MLKFMSEEGNISYDMDRNDPADTLASLRQACGVIIGEISYHIDKPFEELMGVFAKSLVEGEFDPVLGINNIEE